MLLLHENIINSDGENNEIEIIDSDHLAMAAAGDHIGLPFEFTEQSAKNGSGLSKFSSKYIREPSPDPDEDENLYDINPINKSKIKNVYKFGFMLLDHKDYNWKEINNGRCNQYLDSVEINFINKDNKTTDDTKFMMDGGATFVKHESRYQLTKDRQQYDFVAPSENFKTLTDDYTN